MIYFNKASDVNCENGRTGKNMKILGIDPGYAILGYGVVEKTGNIAERDNSDI